MPIWGIYVNQEAISERGLLQQYISYHTHSIDKIPSKAIEETNGLFCYVFCLTVPQVTTFHGREGQDRAHTAGGMPSFWNQGGYNPQAYLQLSTSSTKAPSSKGSLTSQNRATHWGPIDQTLVLVADISYATRDKKLIWTRQPFYKLLLVAVVGFDFETGHDYTPGWSWTHNVAQDRVTWKSWNPPASSFQVLEF